MLFIEWFYFVLFLCGCRYWSRISTISHFICSFYCPDFKKRIKNLNIHVSFFLFVDNRLFISQEKYFTNINANLFYNYNIMSSLLNQFRLVVEYGKTENFHFSRSHSIFNSPALDFSQIGKLHSLF